ncbi:MAG: nicotinate-nicotinamide nucleotide adenylyltransferase [archaeon]
MSIAIFGGTFDPIHLGHLLIAEESYNKMKLDEVIFMPAGIPPHKDDYNISSAKHRLNMLKLAIADNKHFSYSTLELEKEKTSFTVDTLRFFKKIIIKIFILLLVPILFWICLIGKKQSIY